jgi:uncharacterized protein (DUF58 family)
MPTRHLVNWIAVLLGIGYAAVSQGNGPAYLPAYALFSLMLISWVHNRANVHQLELTTPRQANAFAGTVLLLPFKLRNRKKRIRLGLNLATSLGGSETVARLEDPLEGAISIPKLKRGLYQVEWLEVSSVFPLGIFRANTRHSVSCECAVYPEAIGDKEIPRDGFKGEPRNSGLRTSGDDFAGVRNYMVGESQRHIDWKAVARGLPLMVKQFESTAQSEVWLDASKLRELDFEVQLSQIAKWIVECERAGFRYGLQCNERHIPPAHGNLHFHRCLRELAAVSSRLAP